MRQLQVSLLLWAFFIASLLGSIACDRKTTTEAQISLSFPSEISAKGMLESTAASFLPDHVIINVSGEGVREKIVYSWDRCKDCPEGEKTFPEAFSVGEAESGKAIMVQALAVYKDSGSAELKFYYGNFNSIFNAGPIILNVNAVGSSSGAISGRISGRYLTGTDLGPTGTIEMSFDFDTSDAFPALVIEESYIINGWFNIFSLTGMSFKYTVAETGELLWGNPVALDSDEFNPSYTPDAGATYPQFNRVIKAYIPVHLEYHSANYLRDAQIFTWGFWGTASSNIAIKRACTPYIGGLSAVKAKMFKVDGIYATSTALVISRETNPSGVAPTIAELLDDTSDVNAYPLINVHGGALMTGSCSDLSYSAPEDKYLNYFKVEQNYLDGVGNDQATGFNGIFKNQYVINRYTAVNASGDPSTFSFELLPGIADVVGEISVYTKATSSDIRIDSPKCDGYEGLSGLNFAGAVSVATGISEVDVSTALTSAEVASGAFAVVCFKDRNTAKKHGTIFKGYDLY